MEASSLAKARDARSVGLLDGLLARVREQHAVVQSLEEQLRARARLARRLDHRARIKGRGLRVQLPDRHLGRRQPPLSDDHVARHAEDVAAAALDRVGDRLENLVQLPKLPLLNMIQIEMHELLYYIIKMVQKSTLYVPVL